MIKKINEAQKYNKEIIKAKIISTEGSVPRNNNTFMLISKNNIFGSIGGGQLEFIIIELAKKHFKKNKFREIVNVPLGPSIGQCCGGYVQVEIEKFINGFEALKNESYTSNVIQDLYIFGAGHVGQELSTRVLDLDFNVNLVDSREEYLNLQKNKKIIKIYAKMPWLLLKNIKNKPYYIVLTHSHDHDFKIVNEILYMKDFDFLGLIGSKTKFNRFKSRLIKFGHTNKDINKIECPIGLKNISSKKPAEIAISIIGRLLEYRSNKDIIKNNNNESLVKINEY
tara:strand:- start:1683 stop:2528 length:846 start_codon:yes stop_codon:yes gene_type:complete